MNTQPENANGQKNTEKDGEDNHPEPNANNNENPSSEGQDDQPPTIEKTPKVRNPKRGTTFTKK